MKIAVSLFVALTHLLNGAAAIHRKLQMVENPIDEESYIVVLKDQDISIASVQQRVDVLTSSNPNVQVKHVYRSTLKGFAAKMTLEEAEAMADSDEIDFIEQDGERRALPSDIWGIDRVDQRDLPLDDSYSTSSDGSGVTAYIIDTGIRLDHEEFEGRATWGTNTAKDNKDEDCDGHGTHVAGTVGGKKYGVAKKVSLVAVKVLTCNGTGSVSGVIAGYDWIRQNAKGPSTANASLGGFKSNAENKAIAKLHNSGVVTVVAAGNNNGDACDASPASAAAVLTVAASDHRDRRASFSNWGSCIDIFAPGKSITSATNNSNKSYASWDGTSMASPHVCGAAALLLSAGMAAADVDDKILSNATQDKITDRKRSPNLLLYVGDDSNPPTPPTSPPPTPPTGTPAPSTPAPTDDGFDDGYYSNSTCFDSFLEVKVKKQFKGCWDFTSNDKLCKRNMAIKTHCPWTCETCEEYACEDSTAKFKVGRKTRSCKWLRKIPKKKREKQCRNTGIYFTCRKTCNFCI